MVPSLLHHCCRKVSITYASVSSSAAARLIPSLSQQAAAAWVCLFYPAVIRTLCIPGGSRIGTWFHRSFAFARYQPVLLLLPLALVLWIGRTLRGWVRSTAPALPHDLLCFLRWRGILLLFRPQLAYQARRWTCFWRCFLHWRLLLSIAMVSSSCRYVSSLFCHGWFLLLPTGQIHHYSLAGRRSAHLLVRSRQWCRKLSSHRTHSDDRRRPLRFRIQRRLLRSAQCQTSQRIPLGLLLQLWHL